MKWIITMLSLVVFIYLNNASWIRAKPPGYLSFLAHRGVHQTFSKENLSGNGCTAIRVDKPKHQFLENTIDSIRHSFALGAEIVEIDIHPTTDGKFAVFHDWTIDCRTNGSGVTREQSLEYLQSLDIGYGYTHDGGESFPFRGKGIGKMPSLAEVLNSFPDQKFLINIKSNDPNEADSINEFLDNRPHENLARLSFYGGGNPTARLLSINPKLKGFTNSLVKKCAVQYELIGWTGYVPKACRDTTIAIPIDYAPYFWGWPRLLVSRMNEVNTTVILIDMSHGHTDGIDDLEVIEDLSKDYRGIIWTDKIEQVGRLIN